MLNSFIWAIDRTLLGDTTPGQSGPGSDGNEGVIRIPQTSSITEASSWDGLVSYQGTGVSSRRYQGITLTVDGLNWVLMWRSQEASERQTMI